jgi:ankyrin repeat protein
MLVRDGDEARVRGLLARGACPRAEDSAGYTPLHYAARAGHAAIVRLLLEAGLRIRIHSIRIQHFKLNTDPDPIRIRIQDSGL